MHSEAADAVDAEAAVERAAARVVMPGELWAVATTADAEVVVATVGLLAVGEPMATVATAEMVATAAPVAVVVATVEVVDRPVVETSEVATG